MRFIRSVDGSRSLHRITGRIAKAVDRAAGSDLERECRRLRDENQRLKRDRLIHPSGIQDPGDAIVSMDLLDSLVNAIPDLVWLKSAEGVYLLCNRRFEQFFGAPRSAIVGKTDYDFVDRQLGDFFRLKDREALATDRPTINEETIRFAEDGHEECLETIKTPIYKRDGQLLGVLGIARNITARKRSEEALRLSEEKFARAFESAPILASLSHLSTGQLIDVNSLYCQTLGFTREELLGRTTLELGLLRPEDRERLIRVMEAQGFARNLEFNLYTRSQKPVPCLFSGDIIEVGGQKLLIAMVADITEATQARAHERSLEIQLQQARKMEGLGILAAGVAHNINNVLTVIMGTVSLREHLAEEPLDRDAYRSIDRVCRRGREVVKSLIHFAQPTLSTPAPFELHGLLREVRNIMASSALDRLRIVAAFVEEPLWIAGDAGSVTHALVNVCLNALDATPDTGTLTLRTAIPEPGWVEVSVEDDGLGMTPEVLAHALEPFYTTKEVGKGTGLGLSMTYGVVKAHGGTVRMVSQPGRGTCITLRFPRIPAPVEREADAPPRPSPTLMAMSVFLVDDEEDVRFLMTRMLARAGIQKVRTFPGGEACLEALRAEEPPDLVILDQNMPGLSGIQTMERIRGLYPALPVLISSGQLGIEARAELQRPYVSVLSKPFRVEEIQAKLGQFAETWSDQGHGPGSTRPGH